MEIAQCLAFVHVSSRSVYKAVEPRLLRFCRRLWHQRTPHWPDEFSNKPWHASHHKRLKQGFESHIAEHSHGAVLHIPAFSNPKPTNSWFDEMPWHNLCKQQTAIWFRSQDDAAAAFPIGPSILHNLIPLASTTYI